MQGCCLVVLWIALLENPRSCVTNQLARLSKRLTGTSRTLQSRCWGPQCATVLQAGKSHSVSQRARQMQRHGRLVGWARWQQEAGSARLAVQGSHA